MTILDRFRSSGVASLLFALLLIVAPGLAGAATITIVNNDGAGEGFNDGTPVSPVGGNPGTTRGQQRLNVFQEAANIWGAILTSTVTIQVRAQFNNQFCDASSAVLGSAGPLTYHSDFANAEFTSTWYHQALANRLAETDLSSGLPDINATFNSQLDTGVCLGGLTWYYGFDGLEGANIELLPVVLHEIGHGLGFSTPTNKANGAYLSGQPGVYDRFLFDNTVSLHWHEMTATQRAASAINTGNLVWDGAAAVAAAAIYLDGRPRMLVNSPAGIAGSYPAVSATFGAAVTVGGLTGNLVLADDGVAPENDICSAVVNGGAVSGNIALIDRGNCTFVAKVQFAQAAGATGVIIANNVPGLPTTNLGGTDPSITIPVIGISQEDGTTLKANLGTGVNVTISLHPTQKIGTDNSGRPLMYAPAVLEGGSSVSHWDVSLAPNALMEPFINNDLHNTVDLARDLMEDIGWFNGIVSVTPGQTVAAGTMFVGGATPNPTRQGTSVTFRIGQPEFVRLAIVDVNGRRVRTLHEGMLLSGEHTRSWDGRTDRSGDAAPGVYFITLGTSTGVTTRRVALMN
ncbi:MAG TPA: PA domain-containing protein [Candidatus Limnocylindria bacterium]|nr:PA domain-containing protein [Candidatus Limnocylindria bacterium]